MSRSAWRLPGYRVEELLGAGSSGEVWRGRVNSTGVPVALKRIWLSDRAQHAAAKSEAAILSSLDHPHLMKLHELHRVDDDAIVLVLDLASSGSLAALLARRGRLTVGEVITAIAPIAAALAYAHQSGVVHGDVSAANILFTGIGLPLLADLGVARLLGDAAPVRTTPAYADPAVASGALPGPASDVFMLGGVAPHALTGSPPWPGTVPGEVLDAAASGEQPNFAGRLAAAGVPPATAGIVARALSVEPFLRGTAADLALDLRHSGEPVAVELSAGRPHPSARPAAGAAVRLDSWPVQSMPAGAPSTSGDGAQVGFVGEQPLTAGVRAPSPFAVPAARHLARSSPRVAAGFVICTALLAALVGAAVVWWPFDGTSRARSAPVAGASTIPSPRSTSRPKVRSTSRPGSRSPSRPTSGPTPRSAARPTRRSSVRSPSSPRGPAGSSPPTVPQFDVARARAVLTSLDATRGQAFANRDPALLGSVYASAELLARDRALLTTIVPVGCGLRGVRTQFSHLDITAGSAGRVRLRVRSQLDPSTLMCGGVPSGRAAGTRASAVEIVLVRHGGSYRIVAQRAD